MIQLQAKSQILRKDEQVKVYRWESVTYVDGKPVYNDEDWFLLIGNVQPLDGRDLLLVPEGDRFKEQYFIYTNELEKRTKIKDRVVRLGVNFQVRNIETWGDPPNGYQQVWIVRDDVGTNGSNP